jgi:hypothetical protein
LLVPLLADIRPVRDGAATPEQLVDWLTRMMISAVLFPAADPEGMARSLTAVYRLLTAPTRPRPMRRRNPARRTAKKERR